MKRSFAELQKLWGRPNLAGAEEAGDNSGRDTVIGRDHSIDVCVLLGSGSSRCGEAPLGSPRRCPHRSRCGGGVARARSGLAQAEAEEGDGSTARGQAESRGSGDGRRGGGAERRHGCRCLRAAERGNAEMDIAVRTNGASAATVGACWNYLGPDKQHTRTSRASGGLLPGPGLNMGLGRPC